MPEGRRERKVVTVLFADLVGFTSRAGMLDPEDVEAILRPYHARLRSELERHGGTVEKFIGDAVMAVFGAPVVHEDDAERAVRAALAIRDSIVEDGTLEVRIGVNTGEALVNVEARPDAGEGMAAGDVVNTGARLQAAAPTNGILVGGATYRATERAIEYREHEPIVAKGKADRVPVWEALQPHARVEVEVQRPRAPLVGRARELDVLANALARVRQEHSTQLVTLVGEPGIGKSRLVYELFRSVEADPELIWWRHGRSLPYGEGVSFWALGEIVKAQAGILESDTPEVAAEKLSLVVAEMEDSDWLLAHLRPLVGLGWETRFADRQTESFAAWRRFFEELAELRPLVLVFEDLHWADDGLLDFVDHLVDWATGVPILVVGTTRPELLERRPGWGGGKRDAATISLSPLAPDDTARLLAAVLDRSVLDAETQGTLLQRAGGNPLYTEELARMLADRGESEEVPETIQGVIGARLDVLAPEEKSLLQRAAVIGRVFWLGALETPNGGPRRELEERLHRLERKEFIRRERRSSVSGDDEYLFLHVLVRDVAYGQIPRAERGEKHEQAARWIGQLGRMEDTAEMLAHHYVQALEYARASGQSTAALEDPAARALADAGDRAFALGAYAAARSYYERALELRPQGDPQRPRLLVQHAHASFNQSGPAVADALQRSRDELLASGDTVAAAEVAGLLGWSLWSRGEAARAIETLRRAVADLEGAPPSRAKAVVLAEFARLGALGEDPDAVQRAEAANEAARAAGARDLEARALTTLAIARFRAGDRAGIDDLEKSRLLAEEAGSSIDIIRSYINRASLLSTLGDLEAAAESAGKGLGLALRWGHEMQIRWLRAEEVEWAYNSGRWNEAMDLVNAFLAEVEAGAAHYLEAASRGRRALLRLGLGDLDGALEDEERQLELARGIGDPQTLEPALSISAWVRLKTGDRATAAQHLSEAFALLARESHNHFFAPLAEVAFTAVELGRAAEFLAIAETGLPTRWSEAECAFARGEYARAAELFAAMNALPPEAYAWLTAGDEANVRSALDFYRSAGATFYVRRAEALLPASA